VDDPELGHWTIRINSIRVDDHVISFCNGDCRAVVDTGTSLLAVPSASFSEIFRNLKYPMPPEAHCKGHGPLLHFDLDNITVTVGPKDYARLDRVENRNNNGNYVFANTSNITAWCKPMLMTMDLPAPLGPKLFILGEPVLRKYYAAFDARQKRIGLGLARHSEASLQKNALPDSYTMSNKPADSVLPKTESVIPEKSEERGATPVPSIRNLPEYIKQLAAVKEALRILSDSYTVSNKPAEPVLPKAESEIPEKKRNAERYLAEYTKQLAAVREALRILSEGYKLQFPGIQASVQDPHGWHTCCLLHGSRCRSTRGGCAYGMEQEVPNQAVSGPSH